MYFPIRNSKSTINNPMTSPNQLSFLPEDYMERKARRRSNIICAGLFVVVMAAIGSAFTLSDRGLRDLSKRRAGVESEYKLAARRISEVQSMKEKQQHMARQADLTDSLLERVPRSYLLAEITNSMPNGISLLDLSLETKIKVVAVAPKTQFAKKKLKAKEEADDAPPPLKQVDVTLKVTGIADNDVEVAQFISKLNSSSLLKDVNLVISDEYRPTQVPGDKAGDKMRRFQIEMTLRPDAEVQPSAQQTRTAAVELN
jgi:Tfp pilus assembly protein PilN